MIIYKFLIILAQFTILYQRNVHEVNAVSEELLSRQIYYFYCAIVIDVRSTESRVLSMAFKKRTFKHQFLTKLFSNDSSHGRSILY